MAYQQSDLDKLDAAIASGIQQVTYADGRTVRYQNLDQLLAAKKVIAAEVAMQAAARGAIVRRRVPYYRSGL